jgi:hypothetical protein
MKREEIYDFLYSYFRDNRERHWLNAWDAFRKQYPGQQYFTRSQFLEIIKKMAEEGYIVLNIHNNFEVLPLPTGFRGFVVESESAQKMKHTQNKLERTNKVANIIAIVIAGISLLVSIYKTQEVSEVELNFNDKVAELKRQIDSLSILVSHPVLIVDTTASRSIQH